MPASRPVQACITAVGFPADLASVADMVADNGYVPGALTDLDTLLRFRRSHGTSWTAPRWMTAGDVLFFYHTERGRMNAARLSRQLLRGADVPAAVGRAVGRAVEQAARYAGTIFACAEVSGRPVYARDEDRTQHFRSTIFAPLGAVHVFDDPLPSAEFTRAVTLSTGGTLTPVHGTQFSEIKALLARHNVLPPFLRDAVPGAAGFRDVTQANWPEISTRPDRVFLDEGQLRAYLADYFIAEVRDARTAVHAECECFRGGVLTGVADYMVRVHGRWLPVEAKLNISAERDLPGQLGKYTLLDAFRPRRGLHRGRTFAATPGAVCLVVDQDGVYVTRGGQYVGCGTGRPAWARATLTHDSAGSIRARLAAL